MISKSHLSKIIYTFRTTSLRRVITREGFLIGKRRFGFSISLLLFFFFNVTHISFAQELRFRTFTMHDGLSQMKTTCLLKDDKGYLWVGTRSGLNRFDGEKFEILSTKDGLLHNRIHKLAQLSNGHLLIMTFEGINIYDGQQMQSFPYDFSKVLYDAVLDQSDEFWILPIADNEIIRFDGQSFKTFTLGNNSSNFLLYDSETDLKYTLLEDSIFTFNKKLIAKSKLQIPKHPFYHLSRNNFSNAYMAEDDQIYQFHNDKTTSISSKEIVQSNPESALMSFASPQLDYSESKWKILKELKDQLVRPAATVFDRDSSLWVATENGLVHIPQPAIFTIPENQAPSIWSINEDRQQNIFLGSYGNGLYKYDENLVEKVNPTPNLFYPASVRDKAGELYFGVHNGLYLINENRGISLNTVFSSEYDAVRDQYLLGTIEGIYVTKKFEQFDYYGKKEGLFDCHYIQTVSIDEAGDYWLGSYDGLSKFKFEEKSFTNFTEKNDKLPTQGIFAIFPDQYKNIWLAGDDGLLLYNSEENTIEPIYSEVINENVKSLARYDEDNLLVATKNGLYILNLKKYQEAKIIDIKLINEASGYSGIEPGFEAFFKDSQKRIWTTSATSVNIIHPEALQLVDQSLVANIVAIDEHPLAFRHKDSTLEVNSGNNFITLEVDAIGTHRLPRSKFQYQLDDLEWSAWLPERNIFIDGLAHGTHSLKVRAGPTDRPPNNQFYDQIFIAVHIPIFKRAWFLPTLIAILCLAFSWLIYNTIRIRAANRRYQRLLIRSKYLQNQLLLAEMNPHFIFNVLASIQHKILTNNKKTANDYLVKLSSIIRNFLNSSYRSNKADAAQDTYISLAKEIELLTVFVDFERSKSDEHFDFKLNVPDNIEPENLYLPPMILQPFVENAIKHGLLLADWKGQLTIDFAQENGSLICTIKDDGVGMRKSEKLYAEKTSKPKSYGTKIVQERIALLNELGYQIEVNIEEIQPHGTLVQIKIHDEA